MNLNLMNSRRHWKPGKPSMLWSMRLQSVRLKNSKVRPSFEQTGLGKKGTETLSPVKVVVDVTAFQASSSLGRKIFWVTAKKDDEQGHTIISTAAILLLIQPPHIFLSLAQAKVLCCRNRQFPHFNKNAFKGESGEEGL